jgi:hypothetical protein
MTRAVKSWAVKTLSGKDVEPKKKLIIDCMYAFKIDYLNSKGKK